MCSRYSLISPPEAIRAFFAYRETPNFPARYNIAPTQEIGVVCLDPGRKRSFRPMRWGLLPAFVKDPKAGPPLINARAEGIAAKPAFRQALKGARRPFLLRPRTGGLIAFAALWERWRDRDGGEIDTVAIITCAANAAVTPLHDRMPAVLDPASFDAWLDCEATEIKAALDLLQPARDGLLEAIEMYPKLNDSRRDEPGVQEPLQLQLL